MDDTEKIKKLLEKNLEISEESFRILKKVHRAQSIGRLFKALKWVLVIALAFGAYYYIQPFLDTFWQTVEEIKGDVQNWGEVGEQIKGLPFFGN